MVDKLQVLREEPGFLKLFGLFKAKYQSIGRIGGTVSLTGFSMEEIHAISGFIGIPGTELIAKGRLSLIDFEQELSRTIYREYTLIQLLEEVLQEPLITKQESLRQSKQKEQDFLERLKANSPEGNWWWEWIALKRPDSRWIWSLYQQDSEKLYKQLTAVSHAFEHMPSQTGKYERLPLFSQRMTGNPHYFDGHEITGKLLTYCLQVDQQLKGYREPGMPKTAEELNELFGHYGLLKDDLWSFVTCRGLLAANEAGVHPVWKAAAEMDTVLNMPIKELLKLEKIWPAQGKKVWIVENSSVCATIMDEVAFAPVVCTHGQFRTASLLLFDFLVNEGCQLYYSGDFDPEGLLMASRLEKRYPGHVHFWRMGAEEYQLVMSDEDISSRISQLDSITSPELAAAAAAIKKQKKAGYQEGLLEQLVQDIKKEYMI